MSEETKKAEGAEEKNEITINQEGQNSIAKITENFDSLFERKTEGFNMVSSNLEMKEGEERKLVLLAIQENEDVNEKTGEVVSYKSVILADKKKNTFWTRGVKFIRAVENLETGTLLKVTFLGNTKLDGGKRTMKEYSIVPLY